MHGFVRFDRATGRKHTAKRKNVNNKQLKELVWQGSQIYVLKYIYFNRILHASRG